ncbi:cation-binding protein [Mycobacterium sp. ACS1612]|uniref:hemerythrin domain-containing protein n=1 Tax=Mycobacterium sp. ACS1612 TaxID=1834117 RepID=UPI0007FFACD5|nr:hemerythrin domain-containing protein [Mycobacterium sp. ACS1612]OBF40642.1 cation-binding protein [Mycobacterium sp. ACS1612]
MAKSLAEQTTSELGGPTSVLVRQKRDHVELDRLLDAIDGAAGSEREALLEQLARLVFPHAFAEESVLWPAIRRLLPDGGELTLRIEREHQEINELFAEIEKTDPASTQHREVWSRIKALLREDVRDEEDVLLPKLQAATSQPRLKMLGHSWEMARRIAPTRPHPVVARRPPGNVVAAAPLMVIDRTRDRLDRVSRRSTGRLTTSARNLSAALARAAGVVEHIPLLTRGEHSSTRSPRVT